MSEYIYQAFVTIPSDIILKIGMDLEDKLGTQLVLHCDDLTEQQMDKIRYRFNCAVRELAQDSSKCVEGYTLSSEVVMTIGRYLKNHKKIDAIKEFRSATGTGLRDAKDFIDRYGTGHDAATKFMQTFR